VKVSKRKSRILLPKLLRSLMPSTRQGRELRGLFFV
jgi:hypothetical protein